MNAETRLQQAILRELGTRRDVRLWRSNCGVARDAHGRPVRFGQPGQADLSGVVTVVPHGGPMIGLRLEIEVKTSTGRLSLIQKRWLHMHAERGAIAFVARSAEDAVARLDRALANVVAGRIAVPEGDRE